MIKLFATVCVAAAIGSIVGLIGVHRYQANDVDLALAGLAGVAFAASDRGGERESGQPALESLLGMNNRTPGASAGAGRSRVTRGQERAGQRLQQLETLADSYVRFQGSSFSPAVSDALSGICSDAPITDPVRCVRHARHALLNLRRTRDEGRAIYEVVLVGGRVLWGIAFVLAALWLYRAYARARRESRRFPETA